MRSQWARATLGELLGNSGYIRGPFGSALRRNELHSEGVPVYEQQHAIEGSRTFRFFIDADKYGELKRFTVKPNDLIISCSGTIGRVSMIRASDPAGIISQALLILRPDVEKLLPEFLYYFLSSSEGVNSIISRSTGSVQVNIAKRAIIQGIELDVPAISEQGAITAVLSALDDKIKQNWRTARALERLARAIFRAWFVDFEPVKAKAAGATSFPSMPQSAFDALSTRFVDSEIGPVPEGWEVKPFNQAVHLTMGQSPSSEFYNKEGNGLPFHQGVTDYGFRFPTHRVYCTDEGRLAETGDILLSVRAPVGRINVADRRLVLGRGLAGVRHRNDRQSFLLQQLAYVFAEEDGIGDGTIYKAVTKQFLANMSFLAPMDKIEKAFEDLARPLDGLIASLEMERRKLVGMRDYLLPKLLSGKVRVAISEDRSEHPA